MNSTNITLTKYTLILLLSKKVIIFSSDSLTIGINSLICLYLLTLRQDTAMDILFFITALVILRWKITSCLCQIVTNYTLKVKVCQKKISWLLSII